jgi:hypothetical protein
MRVIPVALIGLAYLFVLPEVTTRYIYNKTKYRFANVYSDNQAGTRDCVTAIEISGEGTMSLQYREVAASQSR